jgi:Ca-activated chloride channel family protein
MAKYRRPLWSYPLFQIPLIFLGIFFVSALLFWLLGIGRPPVAVAIALDLSTSTYENRFNEPGSVMNQEIEAVRAYVTKNSSGILRQPNQVKIFGFASGVTPLTNTFETDSQKIIQELNQSLKPNLVNTIGGGTNLDFAIQEGRDALSNIDDRCRELLLVTDGIASVNNRVVNEAKEKKVRINAIIIGTDAPEVKNATITTGGQYISGDINSLQALFTEKLFNNLNNNWGWILLWLALIWIALMWTLTMILDRWLFQGLFSMPMNFAGRLALCNALFWTVATPLIAWRLYQIFNLALPFISSC